MPAPVTAPTLPVKPDAAIHANASSASRFSDALLALLAPESSPMLSIDDAQALGWNDFLRMASGPGAAADAKGVKPSKDDKKQDVKDEAAALGAEELAALGLPGLPVAPMVMPLATEARPVVEAAGTGPIVDTKALVSLRSAQDAGADKSVDLKVTDLSAAVTEKPADPREAKAHDESFAALLHAAQPTTHEAKAAVSLTIDAPVGGAAFHEQTADTVRWMVRHGESRAEINLRPEELGPIQIELRIVQDVAQVTFVAAHPDTRDALQDQLPQLAELLAESGIQLGQANVQDEDAPRQFESFGDFRGNGIDPDIPATQAVATGRPAAMGNRLVDTFA